MYWSRLILIVSLASCILAVSLARSEPVARYRGGYSGYRRNYNPGYFGGYNSYRHEVERSSRGGLRRKYGYKIVSPPTRTGMRTRPNMSPSFSLNLDFPSQQKLAEISSNKIDVKEKVTFTPFVFPAPKQEKKLPLIKSNSRFSPNSVNSKPSSKPAVTFPGRIIPPSKPAVPSPGPIIPQEPAVPSSGPIIPTPKPAVTFPRRINPPSKPAVSSPGPIIPPPQPAVPSSGPIIPPPQPAVPSSGPIIPPPQPAVPSPGPIIPPPQPAVPSLPEAVPAVPGRPVLSAIPSPSSSPGRVENTFVPMPVPAVPGL